MKKSFLLYICLVLSSCLLFAETGKTNKTFDKNALTVVSFSQDFADFTATISLRNNTDTTIYSFSANIIYKDMNGEVLDYKHINKRIKIPPKCSKTFTILAFGRSADYVYYKADYIPKSERAFMIDFELKSYNDNKVGIIQLIVLFALVLPVIFIFFGLIPYKMAKSRGRNPIHWIFLCFIITPLWVYIILAIIGDSEEKRRQYYEQLREYEEKRRQYYEQMTEDE